MVCVLDDSTSGTPTRGKSTDDDQPGTIIMLQLYSYAIFSLSYVAWLIPVIVVAAIAVIIIIAVVVYVVWKKYKENSKLKKLNFRMMKCFVL